MAEGTKFGRYQLLQRLAVGGMAEIFLAKQHGPGHFERSVVIKRILPHLAQDPKFVEMFLDEAAVAVQLNHPNIAQVYDFGHEDSAYYIAMELIRGPDLANVLTACRHVGAPPPIDVTLRIITQVASALDYAHHAVDDHGRPLGLVHRDVSPQNVLVSYDGVVKLVDFGIAKAAGASHQTEAGLVKGKFSYMAPEQLRGDKLDGRCDEYATGLLLYELLTLTQGLPGDGPSAIAAALSARIEPIVNLRADLPAGLADIVNHVLRADREERYPSCRELQEALDGWLMSRGLAVRQHEVSVYLANLQERFGAPISPVASAAGKSLAPATPLPASPSQGGGGGAMARTISDTKLSPSASRRAEAEIAATSLRPSAPPPVGSGRHPAIWIALGAAGVLALAGGAWFALEDRLAPPPVLPTRVAEVPHPAPPPVKPPQVAEATPTPPTPTPTPVHPPAPVPTPKSEHRPPPAAPTATLSVSSEPSAEAFLDGRNLGHTPIVARTVPAGRHTLRLSSDEPLVSHESKLTLSPGQSHAEVIHLRMGKVIFLIGLGARVAVSGQPLGQTPMPPRLLYEGTYDAVVEWPDLRKTVHRKLTVKPGQPTILKVLPTEG